MCQQSSTKAVPARLTDNNDNNIYIDIGYDCIEDEILHRQPFGQYRSQHYANMPMKYEAILKALEIIIVRC